MLSLIREKGKRRRRHRRRRRGRKRCMTCLVRRGTLLKRETRLGYFMRRFMSRFHIAKWHRSALPTFFRNPLKRDGFVEAFCHSTQLPSLRSQTFCHSLDPDLLIRFLLSSSFSRPISFSLVLWICVLV